MNHHGNIKFHNFTIFPSNEHYAACKQKLRNSGDMKDLPDPSFPNISGFSIRQGSIVQGNLGGWSFREVKVSSGGNFHAQGGCHIGLAGQACLDKVQIYPVRSTSRSRKGLVIGQWPCGSGNSLLALSILPDSVAPLLQHMWRGQGGKP